MVRRLLDRAEHWVESEPNGLIAVFKGYAVVFPIVIGFFAVVIGIILAF